MSAVKLVMGGSGFLGSHVVRQLVERGDTVRVWVRRTSSSAAFDDLPVEVVRGELDDPEALRAALAGVATLFYCIVDVRAHLRDPAPLMETNVRGLRHVLEAAVDVGLPRLVFCSTVGTMGVAEVGPVDETVGHNWLHLGGSYIRSRLEAEQLVLAYHRDRGLDAVVLNVGTTYGPRDHGPTGQGALVRAAAHGKMPVHVRHASMEVVGVEDAARAFLLAEDKGRAGERYIISESFMTSGDVLGAASRATGATPPRVGIPLRVMQAAGLVGEGLSRVLRRDILLNTTTVRLMHFMSPLDHTKAVRELGWEPRPTSEAIADAAHWFVEQQRSTS